jgi:hypothetical protein
VQNARKRIWSLLSVLRFYAQSFMAAAGNLSQIAHILNRGEGLRNSHVPELGGMLGELMRECEKVDLPMTLAQLKRIKEGVDKGTFFDYKTMNQQLQELMNRMWDELDTHVFYQIETNKSRYYEEPEKLVGGEIAAAFPSAASELSDASKCYGLGRNTPCVFHSMRALEVGLSCMAKVFGVSADHTNWQNIIDQVEARIRDLAKTKPKNWKQDQEFYSQAASHFIVFKDAWRNYTAHMRGKYDDEETTRILDNVCGFMRKLATKLHE